MAKCPSCQVAVERDAASFPFCSPRCKLIDLGRWLDGEYRIPGEPVAQDNDEGVDDPRSLPS